MSRMNHDRRAFVGALLASVLAPGTALSADRVGYLSGGASPRDSFAGPQHVLVTFEG